MTVLDLRTWWDKAGTLVWGRPTTGETTRGDPGAPASWSGALHDRLMARRLARRQDPPDDLFVFSVGNLALGGTGKPPVTIALARDLAARGLRGAVLTRGFGSRLEGPLTVDGGEDLAGDEARLMARGLAGTGWTVVQSRDRTAGLRWARRSDPGPEVVIAEDGHQTGGLGRHLDVLILDRWRREGEDLVPAPGPVVPFGPWRESRTGADRADIWVVEGGREVPARGRGGRPVATFTRRLELAAPPGFPSPDTGVPWASLAGIARPEAFESGAADGLGVPPALAIRPGDHARFGPRLVARVRRAMDAAGAAVLVTTAKDWVKLEAFWKPAWPVLVARLDILWGPGSTLPDLVAGRLDARRR